MLSTERLRIYPASREQMEAMIASEQEEELKKAYDEMLEGCLRHPDQWEWYAIWMIEKTDGTHIGDNRAYLASTNDKLLWIHSTDDPMVNYKYNAGQVLKLNNPNVRVITVENKRHNPQYTHEALKTMNAWIGEYNRLVREKKLATPEARKAYFADKPIERMTERDPAVFDEILHFIGA